MCVGREVLFSLILLFCIAVLCDGTGAFGDEVAGGSSACGGCLADRLFFYSCNFVSGRAFLSAEGSHPSFHPCAPIPGVSAMAIPDGPGAVCLGILGFVCVSVMKNRKVWLGLCLCVLSSGRMGAARLSRAGIAGPERANPDASGQSEPAHLLRRNSSWRSSSPLIPSCMLGGCILGPHGTHPFLSGPRDDRGSLAFLPRADAALGGLWKTGPGSPGRMVPVGSLSVRCVELARPPPHRSQEDSG